MLKSKSYSHRTKSPSATKAAREAGAQEKTTLGLVAELGYEIPRMNDDKVKPITLG